MSHRPTVDEPAAGRYARSGSSRSTIRGPRMPPVGDRTHAHTERPMERGAVFRGARRVPLKRTAQPADVSTTR
jgi:hypothetical protein